MGKARHERTKRTLFKTNRLLDCDPSSSHKFNAPPLHLKESS